MEVVATGDDNTDQANVQREIRQVLKRKGDLRVVQGRGFQVGDTAVVDFDAARADTGEVFSGAKRVKTQLDSDSADMQFLPGQHWTEPLHCSVLSDAVICWTVLNCAALGSAVLSCAGCCF